MKQVVQVLFLALTYAVSGWLGLQLAIPPGYATAIFPASGIALGAVLLWGNRMLYGVFIGSAIMNLFLTLMNTDDPTLKTGILSSFIGLGAAAQAWVGAFLCRRFAGKKEVSLDERYIWQFIFLIAPLSCLVSSSLGVGALYAFGKLSIGSILQNGAMWWIGDTVGVMILTPLMMILFSRFFDQWGIQKWVLTFITTMVFAAFIGTFYFASVSHQEKMRLQFKARVMPMGLVLEDTFNQYCRMLTSIEGFYRSSTEVTFDEFVSFVETSIGEKPGTEALGWIPRVSKSELPAFEKQLQKDYGMPKKVYEIKQTSTMGPVGEREEYYPVKFVSPIEENHKAVGFDLASNPTRKEALKRSLTTKKQVATGPIRFITELAKKDRGFLILNPIYKNSDPSTCLGFAAGAFKIEPIINEAFERLDLSLINTVVFDATNEAPDILSRHLMNGEESLYTTDDQLMLAAPNGTHYQHIFDIAGRKWGIRMFPTLEYLSTTRSYAAWFLLLSGFLFTALLQGVLLVNQGRTVVVQRMVEKKTKELKEANKELENFTYIASHDLRSPLVNIKGFTDELTKSYEMIRPIIEGVEKELDDHNKKIVKEALEEDIPEAIDYIADSVSRMDLYSKSILNLSRIGRIQLSPSRIKTRDLVDKIISSSRHQIKEKKINVQVDDLPIVVSDELALNQILGNLIDNAIKYMPTKEGNLLSISASVEGDDVRFSVTDNGVGIPESKMDKVFELFQRGPQTDVEGEGLGLAYVKRLVRKLGGQITCHSKVGEGTTFTFTIKKLEITAPMPSSMQG